MDLMAGSESTEQVSNWMKTQGFTQFSDLEKKIEVMPPWK